GGGAARPGNSVEAHSTGLLPRAPVLRPTDESPGRAGEDRPAVVRGREGPVGARGGTEGAVQAPGCRGEGAGDGGLRSLGPGRGRGGVSGGGAFAGLAGAGEGAGVVAAVEGRGVGAGGAVADRSAGHGRNEPRKGGTGGDRRPACRAGGDRATQPRGRPGDEV